jgi:hypothetical protein
MTSQIMGVLDCLFTSGNALFCLSKLSVWWLRLGVQIQRIKPDNPEQNGRHERVHLTLKKEATKPAAFNFLQQQERFDNCIRVYNNERLHWGYLYTFTEYLRAAGRARVTVPRSNCSIDSLWSNLPRQAQNQSLDCVRRPNGGRSTGR